MNKIYLLAIMSVLAVVELTAQRLNTDLSESTWQAPSKEIIFSLKGHTAGMGVGIDYGFIKKNGLTHSIHLEFLSLKHPKEVRQRGDGGGIGSSFNAASTFIYGKRNQLYSIHVGYGGKFYFSKKAKTQGVSVGVSYGAGPSLGLVKPYYLNLRTGQGDATPQAYTEENSTIFLNEQYIQGASGFAYGWSELSVKPGAYLKAGLNFDWGSDQQQLAKMLEVGMMFDIYTQEISIMLTDDNQAIFPTLYASFQIGKRG